MTQTGRLRLEHRQDDMERRTLQFHFIHWLGYDGK